MKYRQANNTGKKPRITLTFSKEQLLVLSCLGFVELGYKLGARPVDLYFGIGNFRQMGIDRPFPLNGEVQT